MQPFGAPADPAGLGPPRVLMLMLMVIVVVVRSNAPGRYCFLLLLEHQIGSDGWYRYNVVAIHFCSCDLEYVAMIRYTTCNTFSPDPCLGALPVRDGQTQDGRTPLRTTPSSAARVAPNPHTALPLTIAFDYDQCSTTVIPL